MDHKGKQWKSKWKKHRKETTELLGRNWKQRNMKTEYKNERKEELVDDFVKLG